MLATFDAVRSVRSAPSSTHVNGYYFPPPSKDNVWSKRYSHIDNCKLVHQLSGERRGMTNAFWRFKRLDWGMYIRSKGGKTKKMWKKSPFALFSREQHVFCAESHVRRFERMFHPEWKAKRHLPEDIYEKYNQETYCMRTIKHVAFLTVPILLHCNFLFMYFFYIVANFS
jgi:hypothetical protein